MGWRCTAAAARLEEFNPLDIASAGLRITGIELLMFSDVYFLFMGRGAGVEEYNRIVQLQIPTQMNVME